VADRRQRLAVAAIAAALVALPAPPAQARAKCGAAKAHHKAKPCRAGIGLRPRVSPALGSRGLDPGHVAPAAIEAYPVAVRLNGVLR
jgi:hypothetical protein